MTQFNPLRSRPPVHIPTRPAITKAQKVAAYNAANGLCELCGKPVPPTGTGVEYDHREARAISGDDSAENLRPVHVACHAGKTPGDVKRIAKAKRQAKLTAPRVKSARAFKKPPGMKYDWSRGRYVNTGERT